MPDRPERSPASGPLPPSVNSLVEFYQRLGEFERRLARLEDEHRQARERESTRQHEFTDTRDALMRHMDVVASRITSSTGADKALLESIATKQRDHEASLETLLNETRARAARREAISQIALEEEAKRAAEAREEEQAVKRLERRKSHITWGIGVLIVILQTVQTVRPSDTHSAPALTK